jgi:hypothetical protein
MPAQPAWFHRLDAILETLRGMSASHLDRLAVEKLFGVRERRARQLMAGLAGLRVGNAVAVSRLALIERLEQTMASGIFEWERNRRARLIEELDRSRRVMAGRNVHIKSPANVVELRFANLCQDIFLRPGELRIEFHGAEDLATKLFELANAISNDWLSFAAMVEEWP